MTSPRTKSFLALLICNVWFAVVAQQVGNPEEGRKPPRCVRTTVRRVVSPSSTVTRCSLPFEKGGGFGGIGGIAPAIGGNDKDKFRFVLVSEDTDAPRMYTVEIALEEDDDGDLQCQARRVEECFFPALLAETRSGRRADLEALALTPKGTYFIASEGVFVGSFDESKNPFLGEFDAKCKEVPNSPRFDLPQYYLKGGSNEPDHNKIFEAMTLEPGSAARHLYGATEHSLVKDNTKKQDDDIRRSLAPRIAKFDVQSRKPEAETFHVMDDPSTLTEDGVLNEMGLAALLALDEVGTLLVLERARTVGNGQFHLRLYEISFASGADVLGTDIVARVAGRGFETQKRLVLDFDDDLDFAGAMVEKFEGMSFLQMVPFRETNEGDSSTFARVIFVSDNDFRAPRVTEFLILDLELDEVSTISDLVHGLRADSRFYRKGIDRASRKRSLRFAENALQPQVDTEKLIRMQTNFRKDCVSSTNVCERLHDRMIEILACLAGEDDERGS